MLAIILGFHRDIRFFLFKSRILSLNIGSLDPSWSFFFKTIWNVRSHFRPIESESLEIPKLVAQHSGVLSCVRPGVMGSQSSWDAPVSNEHDPSGLLRLKPGC